MEYWEISEAGGYKCTNLECSPRGRGAIHPSLRWHHQLLLCGIGLDIKLECYSPMKIDTLLMLFIQFGFYVTKRHHAPMVAYYEEMMRRKRLIVCSDESGPVALITFFVTNDYTALYKKSTWDLAREDENGSQIYVDKLVCRQWTTQLRKQIREVFEAGFPSASEAFYHREPFDRCVKIYRRGVRQCIK